MTAKGHITGNDAADRLIEAATIRLPDARLPRNDAERLVRRVLVSERNRTIASLRGRLRRIPRLDASPEYIAVDDLVRALDEMEQA